MTNEEFARGLLTEALDILHQAEGSLQTGTWNLVVRRSQEAVELALKAVLRAVGIEVPLIHDVGILVQEYAGRIPPELRGRVDRMAAISKRLTRERGRSFYGDEQAGLPPQALYSEMDAQAAFSQAGEAVEWSRGVIDALSG